MKLVSICIPTYKELSLLQRCLDSIFIQDLTNYEIIITDDSIDNNIQQYIHNLGNPKIRYYKNEPSLGSPQNWNKGISLAEGKYIKIMHHDDWFATPHALMELVNCLEKNSSVDFAFCHSYDIKEKTKIERGIKNREIKQLKKSADYLFNGNYIGAPSVTIFRNNLSLYFDPQLVWLVDTEFYIRILRYNPHFISISEPLINIGIGNSQITNWCIKNKELIIKEHIYVYNKLFSTASLKNRFALLKILAKNQVYSKKDFFQLASPHSINLNTLDLIIIRFYLCKLKIVSSMKYVYHKLNLSK